MLRTLWNPVSWFVGTRNNGISQETGLHISSSEEILAAIEKMIKGIEPKTKDIIKDALQTLLPNLVGREIQSSNRKLPVTYKVAGWYTPEMIQRGRNQAQVPGILTLRIGGDSKEKRPLVGFDDYFFILDNELNAVKIARIVPYGEDYNATKHFDDLWKTVLKDSYQKQREHGRDVAKKLGVETKGGNISVVIFEKD